MELTTEQIERELEAIATGAGLSPLENPAVKPITEEMLLLPHPSEPGVRADGTACPPENPPLDNLCTP